MKSDTRTPRESPRKAKPGSPAPLDVSDIQIHTRLEPTISQITETSVLSSSSSTSPSKVCSKTQEGLTFTVFVSTTLN